MNSDTSNRTEKTLVGSLLFSVLAPLLSISKLRVMLKRRVRRFTWQNLGLDLS